MDEPLIDFLRTRLRAAGSARWKPMADAINEGRPGEKVIGEPLLRKLAYGDRGNPGVVTVQPVIDYLKAIDEGRAQLPEPETKATA